MNFDVQEAQESRTIYEWGRKYIATSTVGNDFIPLTAKDCWILGIMANSETSPRLFLDFSSGYSLNMLGYNNHNILWQGIIPQLQSGLWGFPTNDWYHRQPVLLAKRLCEIAPIKGDKKVFFSSEGTTAIEAAIKMCEAKRDRERKERFLFLSYQGSFHGRTKGSLSLTASKAHYKDAFRTSQGVIHMPFPADGDTKAKEEFDYFIRNHPTFGMYGNHTSAVILELIQGEGGINPIDKESLDNLIEACQRHNIYLIVDEVQTGMYRTGKMFACEYYGIKPDIICLAKGVGAGFPLGITIANSEFDFSSGQHSSTNGGNLVACSAANVMLDEIKRLDEYELERKIEILAKFTPHGVGLMRKITLPNSNTRDAVVAEAYKRGLILIGAGKSSIRLMPPLTISEKDLRWGINILKEIT